MEKIIYALSVFFSSGTKYSQDVMEYGLSAIFSTILCLGIGIIISIIIGTYGFVLLFLLILTPIKLSIVSYHCKSLFSCTICFNILILINSYFYKIYSLDAYFTIIFIIIIAVTLFFLTYSVKEHLVFYKILFAYSIGSILIFMIGLNNILIIVFLVYLTELILILLKKITTRTSN